MFRELGKMCRELWAIALVGIVVVGQWTDAFAGSWVNVALNIASVLLFLWLVLFAIGVSRGEPNP